MGMESFWTLSQESLTELNDKDLIVQTKTGSLSVNLRHLDLNSLRQLSIRSTVLD